MLQERIQNRTARAAVVGLGVAGLYQAVELALAGFTVSGYDTDPLKIAQLGRCESYVSDVPADLLRRLTSERRFTAAADPAVLQEAEVILISVPTGITADGEPDLSAVQAALVTVAEQSRVQPLVIIKSTGYPGMTMQMAAPLLAARLGPVGSAFHLAFAPERGDPGNRKFDPAAAPPRVISGATDACVELTRSVYSGMGGSIHVASSPTVAELAKLHENLFRFVNIAYVNEVSSLCRELGVDPYEVVELAATKPFGFMPFFPGPGVGGMYIPVNPSYLLWVARRHSHPARILEAAIAASKAVPEGIVSEVEAVARRSGVPLLGARVALLGLGYKKDSGDIRNSPSLAVFRSLRSAGAAVTCVDPHVETFGYQDELIRTTPYADLRPEEMDVLVILTDHSSFDWERLLPYRERIVDARGTLRKLAAGAAAGGGVRP